MKANKTNLRQLIDWSSSRYNEWKKDEVVFKAQKILQSGEGRAVWTTGSYSERGHLGGWTWTVDGAAKTMTRRPGFNGRRESVFTFDA
jgi:hypothetical protein